MASRKILKAKHHLRAKLLTEVDKSLPCLFCKRIVDDEPIYGKIYAIGDIQCHYFCALLSCCLIQKGKDTEGLFGFLYQDILAEFERSKKHKCSYCGQIGANIGCSVSQCRKQFHLPCGREKNAISMFYGNFKSYCQQHAPKQHIAEHIMVKARQRMTKRNKKTSSIQSQEIVKCDEVIDLESVCVICYETVDTYPTINTFWPPCCGKDAWFHRSCLQRMALSAGMHYLKCPLCNDKDIFYKAVLEQGYYIPDRDAAWELEQNAFQEIYSRVLTCSVDCKCPNGREYDSDCGVWDMKICNLCGSYCAHLYCFTNDVKHDVQDVKDASYVCDTCKDVAGDKLDVLLENVQKLIIQEQAKTSVNSRRGQVMPSRMSLRRTKQGAAPQPSTSRNCQPTPSIGNKLVRVIIQEQAKTSVNSRRDQVMPSRMSLRRTKQGAAPQPSTSRNCQPTPSIGNKLEETSNTTTSRLELNLRTPKRKTFFNQLPTPIENNLISPLKLLQQGLKDKMASLNIRDDIKLNNNFIMGIMRQKFAKPKPLSEKRKIINDILDGLLKNQLKETPKNKTPLKEWNSPQKRAEQYTDIQKTPEKPSCELKNSPLKSEVKEPNEIVTKQDISTENIEVPPIPNQILRSLLNEIDNRKNSLIETLFYKANKLINTKSDDNKNIKMEIDAKRENYNNGEKIEINDEITGEKKEIKDEIGEKKEIKDEITENKEIQDAISGEKKEEEKKEKFALKFSPVDKERLRNRNFNLDAETFKNSYLNEVAMCNFGHKHTNDTVTNTIETALDFAKKAAVEKTKDQPKKNLKRKAKNDIKTKRNKRKRPNLETKKKEKMLSEPNSETKTADVKIKKKKKKSSKKTAHLSIRNKNLKLKIKFQEKQLKVRISNSRKKAKMTQYVLNYGEDSKRVLEKPQINKTPNKKKLLKPSKSPDNLKQTTISNFFTIKY